MVVPCLAVRTEPGLQAVWHLPLVAFPPWLAIAGPPAGMAFCFIPHSPSATSEILCSAFSDPATGDAIKV